MLYNNIEKAQICGPIWAFFKTTLLLIKRDIVETVFSPEANHNNGTPTLFTRSFLLAKLKCFMKRIHFVNVEVIMRHTIEQLKNSPEANIKKDFAIWKKKVQNSQRCLY